MFLAAHAFTVALHNTRAIMEHPQFPQPPTTMYHHHPHSQAGEQGQVVDGEGDHAGHPMVRRSISHQDVLVGGLPSSGVPPDLEKITINQARSTDNLLKLETPQINLNQGPEHEGQGHYPHHYPQHNVNNGQTGRMRMPFPPIPKIEPSPSMVPSSYNMVPSSISVGSSFNPAVSGFGSVTTQVSQVTTFLSTCRIRNSLFPFFLILVFYSLVLFLIIFSS